MQRAKYKSSRLISVGKPRTIESNKRHAEGTNKQYRWHLNTFLKATGLTEEKIWKMGHNNHDPRNLQLQDVIMDYISDMATRLRTSTCENAMAAILAFCSMNDIVLNRKKIAEYIPRNEKRRQDRYYTHDEISKLMQKADDRFRIIILLMANGLREGAIPDLQLKNLEELVIEDNGLITRVNINDIIANVKNKDIEIESSKSVFRIEVYAQSHHDHYFTFVTPECTIFIKEYLRFRSSQGEVLARDSPLIREQFNIRSKSDARKPQKLTLRAINKKLERLIRVSGINTKGEVLRSHGFRKFAMTMMNDANVNFSIREYLVGHRQSRGLDNNYVLPSVESQLIEWAKAIDLLTINSEKRVKRKLVKIETEQGKEIALMKAHNSKLESELKARDEELKEYWKEQRALNEVVKELREEMDKIKSKKDRKRLDAKDQMYIQEDCGTIDDDDGD
jgi:hypothetical protein